MLSRRVVQLLCLRRLLASLESRRRRSCRTMPRKASQTLCCMAAEVSMNLQSNTAAQARPSETGRRQFQAHDHLIKRSINRLRLGLLTAHWHLSASHQVTLVPHKDNRCVLGRAEATQGYPELRSSQVWGPVSYRVQQQVGIPSLHVLLVHTFTVSLQGTHRAQYAHTQAGEVSSLIHFVKKLTSESQVSIRVIEAGSPSTSISFSVTSSEFKQESNT